MDILNLTKIDGGYQMQSWPDDLPVPDGHAIVLDDLDRTAFFDHNGFVKLTTTTEERVVGTHQEPREVPKEGNGQYEDLVDEDNNEVTEPITESVTTPVFETVEDKITLTVVTAWEPDFEAWEEWKASQPEPKAPEPTVQDDLTAMMVDHEYRLTLLELGITDEEVTE